MNLHNPWGQSGDALWIRDEGLISPSTGHRYYHGQAVNGQPDRSGSRALFTAVLLRPFFVARRQDQRSAP